MSASPRVMRPIIRGSASTSGLNAPVAMASSTSWTLYAMSSDRSMTWHSMGLRASGAPVFSQRNTSSSSGYTQNFTPRPPSYLAASARVHGYLTAASSEALVRFTPADRPSEWKTFGSSRVSRRSVCALPSNPPMPAAMSASARSPLWPNGGWPRSWHRHAQSTTSGSHPSMAPTCRPIWATSSVWVSLVRAKSSVPATRICVFAPSLRSADECTTRARSRSKAVRDFDFGGSPAQRCSSNAVYPSPAGMRSPLSSDFMGPPLPSPRSGIQFSKGFLGRSRSRRPRNACNVRDARRVYSRLAGSSLARSAAGSTSAACR